MFHVKRMLAREKVSREAVIMKIEILKKYRKTLDNGNTL